ncbi:hypothetical protein STAS_34471 [Striga asiatica]|uniref:Uncharacterized protein n=1 Tax=Striga asiatica TaxID=4170 RepID=A0A5A7RHQ2_STRAF|nr:hypothetical protein STAS_34471 [Striga asiatica]
MPPPSIAAAPPIATAPALYSLTPIKKIPFFHHHHHHSLSSPPLNFSILWNSSRSKLTHGPASRILLSRPLAIISRHFYEGKGSNAFDPELRSVLELATDSELYELERILFGPSYFSPLLKSILRSDGDDGIMIGEDPNEREDFITRLESRFLFLAADARSTLRGWRPSYRKVLLAVRKQLKIPCSKDLSAEDLEVEIFLHLLQEYSSEEPSNFSSSNGGSNNGDEPNDLELGLSLWKVQKLAALGIGATELRSIIMKGGGMLTLEKLMELVGGRLSTKMLSEAAKYRIKKEAINKGGKLAAIHLESAMGLLAARQGLKAAATRYLGLRSVTQLLGPIVWGTLLADVVIQMLGTDYARILRAIYAFAQIRIYRSYKTASEVM